MNNELKINEKKTTNEWLTEHCSIANLEGHNKSLKWLIETANRMDAVIDTRITDGYSSQGVCFAIQLQGNHSGVLYRIKVTFNPKMAKLLGKRDWSWSRITSKKWCTHFERWSSSSPSGSTTGRRIGSVSAWSGKEMSGLLAL